MNDTERRYSQIEKEALALVWSCRKFSNYILGKNIRLETDHKPLIPLLGKPILIVYHLEFCVSDFISHDLIIPFLMFLVNYFIQQIPFLKLPSPVQVAVLIICIWNHFYMLLFPLYQSILIIYRSIVKLKKLTLFVPKL